jgi:hypothetical protein
MVFFGDPFDEPVHSPNDGIAGCCEYVEPAAAPVELVAGGALA